MVGEIRAAASKVPETPAVIAVLVAGVKAILQAPLDPRSSS